MTPEAQQIAIAEACGWVYVGSDSCTRWYLSPKYAPLLANKDIPSVWQEIDSRRSQLPDYLTDLNAMHDAEKTLTPDQQAQYAMTLHEMHGIPLATFWHRVICSTAAQRAEAFLRTIGKWEDTK